MSGPSGYADSEETPCFVKNDNPISFSFFIDFSLRLPSHQAQVFILKELSSHFIFLSEESNEN